MITEIMNTFDGYFVDERGWKHYRVQGKTYDIRFHQMTLEWECNCLAYKFGKGKPCKHIKEVQSKPK